MKIGIFSCYYKSLPLPEDTKNMVDIYKNKHKYDVKVISSECACLKRFKDQDDIIVGECRWVNLPYLFVEIPVLNVILELLRGVLFFLKSKDRDIVHYQQVGGAFSFFPLLTLLTLSTSKKIVSVHYLQPIQRRFPILNRIYKRADLISVHSESTKRELLKHSNLSKEDIKIIPLGVKIPRLTGVTREKIIFIGPPTPSRGINTAFKALKILKDIDKKQILYIYGNYTETEKQIAIELAKKYGVEGCLYWGGYLKAEELNFRLQESKLILTLHTYHHGGSSTLVHAMANGTPVIATNVGGMNETLGEGGVVIPANDPYALVSAIQLLLDNDGFLKKCSGQGRKRAKNLFSWDKIIELQLKLLKKS